jgi:hypothetical protein
MKNSRSFILLAILIGATQFTFGQNKTSDETKRIVESQNYIFKADRVVPQSGSSQFLTSDYDLTVLKSKIISYLPYFGRAYAPVLPGESGIKFTSRAFNYSVSKKGDKWEVLIQPDDVTGVQQMHLTIFDNGTASLYVINTNRESISYQGYIKEGRAVQKKAF